MRRPSVPPSSTVEETSEIQKLASLAEKLAASRRASTMSSRTLQLPRFDPPVLADQTPPFRDQSRVVTSSPSHIKTSHRLDLTASCLSRQTVAENEEDEHCAFAPYTTRDSAQPSPTVVNVSVDDESVRASTSHANRSVLPHHDCSGSNSLASQSSSSVKVATTINCTTSSAGTAGVVSELLDVEVAQNDDNNAADNSIANKSDLNVSNDCPELGVSQATRLLSSSMKDRVMTTAGDCDDGPLPVSARLIITSPVSNRACFVENPHRRSLCKPLTLTLPHVDDVDLATGGALISDMLHPVTSSSRRHGDAELLVVEVSCGDCTDPTNYGRSWYDLARGDNGPSHSATVVSEPRGNMSANSVPGFSLGGDCMSSDTRSISSQSSLVSDKSSEMSGSLLRSTLQRVTETSALNCGREARTTVRINAPSPVLSPRPRTPSTTNHHSVNSTRSPSATADHIVSKSVAGGTVDRVVTKSVNLKKLKKSKNMAMRQPKKDADVDLVADIQRLSRRSADKKTIKTTSSRLAETGSLANDWRLSQENENESRPIFMSFMSNSLGRHKSLRTSNEFAEHCSAAGNIILSPQPQTGATLLS